VTELLPRSMIVVPVCIEPDETGFVGYSPALSGCVVGGETRDEVKQLVEEAVRLNLASLLKHGDPLPPGCRVMCGIPVSDAVTRNAHMEALPGMPEAHLRCERSDILVPM
jgi:predicted RNase H-like HicB family nuclease